MSYFCRIFFLRKCQQVITWLQFWHSGGVPEHLPVVQQTPLLGPLRGGPVYFTEQPPRSQVYLQTKQNQAGIMRSEQITS